MKNSVSTGQSIHRHLLLALLGACALVLGVGGWAGTTELAGAVIAPGQLVAESSVKLVQHPAGGVVVELDVVEGAVVKAGDVLLRLDDTAIKASLEIVMTSLRQLEAREARLAAELAESETISFPSTLLDIGSDVRVDTLLKGERQLFDLRRSALASQEAQLKERISQLHEEISGLESQITARQKERALLELELASARTLRSQELVSSERVSLLERQVAQTEGQIGQLEASVAQGRGRIAETELQILQGFQDFQSRVAEELSTVQGRLAELRERRIAGESELANTAVRAPQSGQVHELSLHTVGGVAGAGETLMRIVPVGEALSAEVSIAPQDIDQVHMDQTAVLRLSALNLRTTPELSGRIRRISPDLSHDQHTGRSYYTARIELPAAEIARLGNATLTSGMPVEAFIETDRRTALTYLAKPLFDQIGRAFRSE